MKRLLKTVFQRPFTYVELRQDMDAHFVKPPLPAELRDELAAWKGNSGQSLLDYWRKTFASELTEIASEPTWAAQRAALLRSASVQCTWEALYLVAKECKHVDSWSHLVENTILERLEKDQYPPALLQQYFVTLTTRCCLEELGSRRFALDETKRLEVDLYRELDTEIKRFDASLMDLILDLLQRADTETDYVARNIAEVKDTHINPILREQIKLLDVVEEQIVSGSVDIKAVRRSLDSVAARKLAVKQMLDDEAGREAENGGQI